MNLGFQLHTISDVHSDTVCIARCNGGRVWISCAFVCGWVSGCWHRTHWWLDCGRVPVHVCLCRVLRGACWRGMRGLVEAREWSSCNLKVVRLDYGVSGAHRVEDSCWLVQCVWQCSLTGIVVVYVFVKPRMYDFVTLVRLICAVVLMWAYQIANTKNLQTQIGRNPSQMHLNGCMRALCRVQRPRQWVCLLAVFVWTLYCSGCVHSLPNATRHSIYIYIHIYVICSPSTATTKPMFIKRQI